MKQAGKKKRYIYIIILVLVLAVVGAAVYVYTMQNSNNQTKDHDHTSAEHDISNDEPKPEDTTAKDKSAATKLVKTAYEAYWAATYKQEDPDFDKAIADFKGQMTAKGIKTFGASSNDQDPVLCSVGAPQELRYEEPVLKGKAARITVTAVMQSGTTQAVVAVDVESGKITNVSCKS